MKMSALHFIQSVVHLIVCEDFVKPNEFSMCLAVTRKFTSPV